MEDLEKRNKLVTERRSLKSVILDMEDLVLGNAGVDAFDEVFQACVREALRRWQAARGGETKRFLEFRVGGSTAREFSEKVNTLFKKAMHQWPGVFPVGERIDLEPDHLKVCGSFLEDIKLFNSNLQVIDEAFEYLSIKAAKGEKGQYFTPRHVIDMCVKMLNPTVDDYVVDTAAGSRGLTVHTIFHIWSDVFTANGPNRWQSEYASSHVYGLDFDPRSVKIARALNLIACDGKTNVYRANTLDPKMWREEVRVGLRPRLRAFPQDVERDAWNREHFDFSTSTCSLQTHLSRVTFAKDRSLLQRRHSGASPKLDLPPRADYSLCPASDRPRRHTEVPRGLLNDCSDAMQTTLGNKTSLIALRL